MAVPNVELYFIDAIAEDQRPPATQPTRMPGASVLEKLLHRMTLSLNARNGLGRMASKWVSP
jgi:hypothetical protein